VAAVVAAVPLARNLPLLLRVFALEALTVGAFTRRGKPPLVGAALVWTVTAVTFGLFPGLFGLAYVRLIWPLALQQLLNGMIAVVIAELIVVAAQAGGLGAAAGGERPHLRRYAFQAFVLVAVLPVLLLSAVNGQLFAARQENEGAARLHDAVTSLETHIDEYLIDHARAV